ncbi:hypothetical protein BKA00_004770 [Actinomadura coerulea]|uniref:Uncharacterized protein n=1 Tax=Actinomadura coerulea TaxID=46159 RepID=A0A7X0G3S9_9ACTN|nr:hypothetical protein [Actinomadura coerulea]MBB6397856.1 hypothetical protein [Actinomadura coerulea]GGQ19064.1 hypothetical protein GCM10010187_39300 [Actinomadura coerulea]
MGYPGDQGKPGDWPHRQSPHAPYGPGAEAPPYGPDNDESPLAARDEGTGTPPAFGNGGFGSGGFGDDKSGQDQFGQDKSGQDQFGNEAFGGAPYGGGAPGSEAPGERTAAWSDQPPAWGDESAAGGAFGQNSPGEGGFGSYEGMPPGPSGAPERPERRRNLPLIIGGAAVAGILLIGGGVGLSSMLKGDSKPKTEPTQAVSQQPQATPSPTQPVLAPVKLQSRTTDPAPLTLKEVFGKASFKTGKLKYVRTAAVAKKSCAGVVGGTTLAASLKKGRCTQALRATYALSNGSLVGTVGVFNLQTEAAAKKAVKAAAAKDAFLVALPGKGASKNVGKGEALGTSQARGHYVIMTWVQRPDGKKISTKYHAAVRVFGTQLVKGSNLALALHYRETEGKPLRK